MRVYVTGMGIISSLGNQVDTVFEALLENRTGVRAFPEWAKYNGLFARLGAPAHDYDISRLPRAARRTMSRMSEMAFLATQSALAQADLNLGELVSTPRILLCLGSTSGSPEIMETYFRKLFERGGPEGQLGTTFFKVMNHSVTANVASALGFVGPAIAPASACATSAQAMILGWELLQSGLYDVVIAGGADELHYTSSAVFDVVQAASRGYNDRPELSPRPFDRKRDGLVVSEGASTIVLESEASMKSRGARPIAEMLGGAYLCDGTHMSQPQTRSMVEVMHNALERAKIQSVQIQYLNAHATGTVQGDQEEARAIGEVFGKNVPVSSLKGHFGHSLSSCGGAEAIACIQMMKNGVLVPTRNLTEIDPACAQIDHVTQKRAVRANTVMSNNFAFGGINTSLILCADRLEGQK